MLLRVNGSSFSIIGVSRQERDFHIVTDENNVKEIMSAVQGDMKRIEVLPKDMPNMVKVYDVVYRSMQYDIDDKNIACQISFFLVNEVQ